MTGATATSTSTHTSKRHQTKKACSNCRRAHTACDDQRPCSRCVRHGRGDTCLDVPRKKRTTAADRESMDRTRAGMVLWQSRAGAAVSGNTLENSLSELFGGYETEVLHQIRSDQRTAGSYLSDDRMASEFDSMFGVDHGGRSLTYGDAPAVPVAMRQLLAENRKLQEDNSQFSHILQSMREQIDELKQRVELHAPAQPHAPAPYEYLRVPGSPLLSEPMSPRSITSADYPQLAVNEIGASAPKLAVGFAVFSFEHKQLVEYNKHFLDILGLDKSDLKPGFCFSDICTPDTLPFAKASCHALISGATAHTQGTVRVQLKDGSTKAVHITGQTMKNERGEPAAMTLNVTEA